MQFEKHDRWTRNRATQGGKARQAQLRDRALGFPKLFLGLLNARTIAAENQEHYLALLVFGPPTTDLTGSSLTIRSNTLKVETFFGKLLRAPGKPAHAFSREEFVELKELTEETLKALGIRFACDPTAGSRHLTPLPIAIGYLRTLAESLTNGLTVNQLSGVHAEMTAYFRRTSRKISEHSGSATDNAWTSTNCESAVALIDRFLEMDPALLCLLRRCANSECGDYFIQDAIRKAHCSEACRYRAAYLRRRLN